MLSVYVKAIKLLDGDYSVQFSLPIELKDVIGVKGFYKALDKAKSRIFPSYGHSVSGTAVIVDALAKDVPDHIKNIAHDSYELSGLYVITF
jgi:hypothetical protein